MSLESIQAEWDELSNEYAALEVSQIEIEIAIEFYWAIFCFINKIFYFNVNRKRVMNMPNYWRNSKNYNKNV